MLGVPGLASSASPVHIPGLWQVGVLQVAAGEAHCAVLGANGYAYSWGRGKYGQLGHGSFEDEQAPKQVRWSTEQGVQTGPYSVWSVLPTTQLKSKQSNKSEARGSEHQSSRPKVGRVGADTAGSWGDDSVVATVRSFCFAFCALR